MSDHSAKRNLFFIVAYNHEASLSKVLSRIPKPLIDDPRNEVLVIDDGSGDRTFQRGIDYKDLERFSRLTVLKNPVNQGYGGNQKLGYRFAIDRGFDRVFLIHGDGQYAPEHLTRLLDRYETDPTVDAVFGTRIHPTQSPLKGGMPLYKYLGNRILTWMENRILGTSFHEFHSGYRSYSTDLLKRIPFEANSNGFDFDTEIIIQCTALGAKVVEVPIPTHYGAEVCHVNGVKYAKDVLIDCLHYRLHRMGYLYNRKFHVGNYAYPEKLGRYSSHQITAALVEPFSTVLDIGCGSGQIASLLIQKGCVVDGIDTVDPSAITKGVRKYYQLNLATEKTKLAEVLLESNHDYIILADILEHLVEPEHFLDLIRQKTKLHPRPTIIACTGNVGFFIVRWMLFLGSFNYGTHGILDHTHVRLFTKKSFRRLFEQSGFDIKSESAVALPIKHLLGMSEKRVSLAEYFFHKLANLWPSLWAYQILTISVPYPTTTQLLSLCESHTTNLCLTKSTQNGSLRCEL